MQLTWWILEQHVSAYMWIFVNRYIGKFFGDLWQLKKITFL